MASRAAWRGVAVVALWVEAWWRGGERYNVAKQQLCRKNVRHSGFRREGQEGRREERKVEGKRGRGDRSQW